MLGPWTQALPLSPENPPRPGVLVALLDTHWRTGPGGQLKGPAVGLLGSGQGHRLLSTSSKGTCGGRRTGCGAP